MNKYVIKQQIGRGSFSITRYGVNVDTKETVAFKMVSKANIRDYNLIRNEIDTHKNLNHNGIIKYIESIITEKEAYIIMEYAANGNMYSHIVKFGRLTPELTKIYVIQIISAIKYLHNNNIIHRDIKSDNILITDNNLCKICDFGLSILAADDEYLDEYVGSPLYMAPELHKKQIKYNHKIDVWALGIVTYEMLHGFTPFETHDADELTTNVMYKHIHYPRVICHWLKNLINMTLTKNMLERPNINDILM